MIIGDARSRVPRFGTSDFPVPANIIQAYFAADIAFSGGIK